MAKFCTSCGKEIPEGIAFCTECGSKTTEAPQQKQTSEQPVNPKEYKAPEPVSTITAAPPLPPQQTAPLPQPRPASSGALTDTDVKGTKYEPITAWGYIGIMLLMCIPIVGLILTIVWACGGCRKICKRSLARATLIMMAISLVLGIIFTLVGGALINSLIDKSGIETNKDGIFSSLLVSENNENNQKEKSGGLMELFGGGNDSDSGSDYEELGELGQALGALEALGALAGSEELGDLSALFGEIDDINAEAEKQNNGWPKSLRKYPGGESTAVASYRTEITGTSKDEMLSWIDGLKSDGYEYTDFYEFGMSEADMLSSGGWWGTNGEYYISVSYYDGTVTVDHMTELPDLASYFN